MRPDISVSVEWPEVSSYRSPIAMGQSVHQAYEDARNASLAVSTSRRARWQGYVLPLIVYLASGYLEPTASDPSGNVPESLKILDRSIGPTANGSIREKETGADDAESDEAWPLSYPVAYAVRVALTFAALIVFWPFCGQLPRRAHAAWAVVTGAAGAMMWILICRAGWAQGLLDAIGAGGWLSLGQRAGFDPWTALAGSPWEQAGFLLVRFTGLVVVVPLAEEFFLRGFLMRYIRQAEWWEIPFGDITWSSAALATLYGVLSHPAEPLAAAAWFTLVTFLYSKTGNLWTCVLAHSVTNLGLGIYVLVWHDWRLW